MRAPKEPKTFNHPRLYWQPMDLKEKGGARNCGRMRILYPNGKANWAYSNSTVDVRLGIVLECCFQDVSAHKTLAEMRKYDKDSRHPKAIFLGEIK